MLNENEIKLIVQNTKTQLESIVDPIERKVAGGFIAGLECALNE